MKELVKIFFYKLILKPIYAIVQNRIKPIELRIRDIQFVGSFCATVINNKKIYLYNNAFNLETNIFWIGLDNYTWEYTTRKLWAHLCQQANTIVDIGANTGIYSILAKSYNPNSRVIAFEPQPNIFEILKINNKINNFDIMCENYALSNTEGILPFYNYGDDAFTTGNTTAGSLNKTWRTKQQQTISVSVLEFKKYIINRNIKNIDLVKIDVETYEYEVLLGYGDLLMQHAPIIILEIMNKEIGLKIASLFNRNEYTYFNIDEINGLHKVENLGLENINHNYILCPKNKIFQIQCFFYTEAN